MHCVTGEKSVKRVIAALLALGLAACGGGGETSSNAGNDSSFGTSSTASDAGASGDTGSGGAGSITAGDSTSAEPASADGTYRGELTATLSGEGVLPVTDSTELVIVIDGSKVTATAEGRSYEGELDGNAFEVEIPIDEESRGITCQGTPVLDGKVEDGTASGTVSGKGECFSEAAVVPVSVTGEFATRK